MDNEEFTLSLSKGYSPQREKRYLRLLKNDRRKSSKRYKVSVLKKLSTLLADIKVSLGSIPKIFTKGLALSSN